MQKRLLLHIGLPKTGTTSIQASLSASAAVLHSSGISLLSPDAFGKFFIGTMDNAFSQVRCVADRLPHGTILISKESLTWQGRYSTVASAFCRAFEGYDITVFVFLTDHIRLAEKGYRENAVYNDGTIDSPRQYVNKRRSFGCFDYHGLLNAWRSQRGVKDLIIANYDNCNDSVREFGSMIGVDLEPVARKRTTYNSISCEVSLILKRYGLNRSARLAALRSLMEHTDKLEDRAFVTPELMQIIQSDPQTTYPGPEWDDHWTFQHEHSL